MTGCAECERLDAAYESATAGRVQAEADLTAAIFGHDRRAMASARRQLKASTERWRRASGELQRHKQTHGLPAGASF